MTSWTTTERHARMALRPKLREYLSLARGVHRVLERALTTAREAATTPHTVADQVQARLLTQTAATLRALSLVASNGYPIQTLSLLAEAYESAHAVAYVGKDPVRAKEWEEHTDLKDTYPSWKKRKEAVKATLKAALPHITDEKQLDTLVESQERLYTLACMAKHSNPRLVLGHGASVQGNTLMLTLGPVVTNQSIKQSRFALFHASRLLAGATLLFVHPLLLPTPQVLQRFARTATPTLATIGKMTGRKLDHDLDAA